MKTAFSIFFMVAISISAFSQKKADLKFNVSAVCGMCEERIESAYDIKGIVMADYDLKTKMLHVVYKTKFFNTPLDIHKIAANVGHDTDQVKATDEAYSNLHGCCKYREGGQSCSGDAEDNDDHK